MLLIECANGHKAFTEDGRDPDSALTCPPGAGCCEEDHHHGQAANACPGDHAGEHGLGVAGCTVCRPIAITVMPGSVTVRRANG